MLGAILIHNEAFNHAAELIDSRDFFRDAHRRIFDRMVALSERGDAIDFVTLKEELSRGGRARRSRRAGLHRVARRRRAAIGQRRVLRAHRQGKVDASQPDSLGEQDPGRGLRGRGGAGPAPRRGRAGDLCDRRGSHPRRVRAAARSRAEQLRDDREAAAAQGAGHRRADRLRRSRRDDLGPAAVRPRARRRAAVDGQDELRAEHRAARRHVDRHDGRLLQPGDVEGAAVHAHAHVRGAHRRAPLPQRLPEREGLRPAVARARHARRSARVHRRHRVDRRARDAREGAPPQGRARPAPAHHRLHPVDAGARPLREPPGGARVDLAIAEGAREGAAASRSSRCRSCRARPRRAPITGRSSPTCASPARSSRTPTSSCSSTARSSTATPTATPNQEAEGTAEIIIGKQRNGPIGTAKLAFIKEHTRFENLAHGARA